MPARRPSPLLAALSAAAGGPAQQTILDELRRGILGGAAPPGTAIPVGEVARLFGVSPIPVRECLKTLMGEGLVDHRPHAGYVVAQLTRAELREIYVVRGVLETTALRAAVRLAGPADDRHAARAHRELDDAVRDRDPAAYHRRSRHFHLALVTPCRMHRLLHMFGAAWNLTEPFQPMRYVQDADRERLHADHRAMLDAFAARDAAGLVAASEAHQGRLEAMVAGLPARSGLRAEPGGHL
jgi:DNA-binding GntR family transcriptional regulator